MKCNTCQKTVIMVLLFGQTMNLLPRINFLLLDPSMHYPGKQDIKRITNSRFYLGYQKILNNSKWENASTQNN